MRYLLPVVAAALIAVVSCTPPADVPVVTATAIGDGGTLRLQWAAITGATGYNVYLDGVKTAVTGTSYDVTTPAAVIEVSATSAGGESDKSDPVNTEIVKTASLTVDNMGGTGDPAFYFNTSGTALAIPLTQAANIDFVLDTTGIETELRSPDSYDPVYNAKDNASAQATTTDFDTYDIAEAAGQYNTVRVLSSGALYSLWIDLTNDGWSTDDHFAKMKYEGLAGNTLTLTFGYQLIGGLRWLLNP